MAKNQKAKAETQARMPVAQRGLAASDLLKNKGVLFL
jgi:hypothetical protein